MFKRIFDFIGRYMIMWLLITGLFYVTAFSIQVLFGLAWTEIVQSDGFVILFVLAHLTGFCFLIAGCFDDEV